VAKSREISAGSTGLEPAVRSRSSGRQLEIEIEDFQIRLKNNRVLFATIKLHYSVYLISILALLKYDLAPK
jgi:hypothetical protein